jgi:hypothetical protein
MMASSTLLAGKQCAIALHVRNGALETIGNASAHP